MIEGPKRPTGCHCFCRVNHGDQMGCCEGRADQTVLFHSKLTGIVPVAMCAPCVATTLAAKPIADRMP